MADGMVRVIGPPNGERPFRSHADLSRYGSEVVPVMCDRSRGNFCRRIGMDELLTPHVTSDHAAIGREATPWATHAQTDHFRITEETT
ncbi:hypothetical protein [Streptomyces sp. NPDC048845]|uniref:hypothetical protein n=1 Tax=Streptomyces sp. NPDC048845 TaxID=3155390 RepID=UPI00341C23D9